MTIERRSSSLAAPWVSRLRSPALLVFLGIALLMMSLSPWAFRMSGYMEEEVGSARQAVAKLGLIHHPSAEMRPAYPRNGAVPLLFHVPYVLASQWIWNDSGVIEDALLSTQPVLFTAGIVAIVFAWSRHLAGSTAWAMLISMSAAFATLLWPYAYIGLETQQSFFLLLAAFLALQLREKTGIAWTGLFIFSAAVAVSVKSNGAFILPAVAFLVYEHARSGRRAVRLAMSSSVIGVMFLLAAYTRSFFWASQGGTKAYIQSWLVSDALTWALNVAAFLGSPNKGLFVFSPILILAAVALPSMLRRRDSLAIFTVLVLGGLMSGFALLTCWADENWGPRYLHSAVAPMMLCLGASRAGIGASWRRSAGILLLSLLGFVVSAFGALFWYGSLHQISVITGQNTLEAIHGDIAWNHIKFNGRLFLVWLKPPTARDTAWTPDHVWYFTPPKDPPTWRTIDLKRMLDVNGRPMAVPHSYVFQRSALGVTRREKLNIGLLASCAIVGIILLLRAYVAGRREDYGPFQSPTMGTSVESP